ncbi:hypothetical protein [Streptomyces atroolivaceus]|uniref:hypothetical protein n=1 Tax=Streptomyces atroolivaceus TaxID=66869 RepID=UPI0037B35145
MDTSEVRISGVELTPERYLEFAEKDLEDGTTRGLVNSFGNSKRCTHLLIDELLWQYGLLARNKKMSFPMRLDMLGDLGILSSRILRRLNVQRNVMEHEYVAPTVEVTQDAVDVAGLLVLASSTLRRRVICEAVVGDVQTQSHFLMSIDRSSGDLEFREISAPADRFLETNGVRRFGGHVRSPGGKPIDGVSISDECTKRVSLTASNKTEWGPMLDVLMDIQQSVSYHDTPFIGFPINGTTYGKVLRWFDGES